MMRASPGRPRQRALVRRRRWRWLLRLVLWGLAILALVTWGAQSLLSTTWAREYVRQRLERLVSEGLATPVSIGSVVFTLLPCTIELRDVRLGGGLGSGGPVPLLIEIPWALIDADLWALRANDVRLDRVVVERPVVHVAFLADGSNNLFVPPEGRGGRRFDVFVGQLVVDEAEVLVERHRLRLSVRANATHAAFQGRGELRLLGTVAAEDVSVTLPGGRPLHGLAVTGTALLERGGLRIEDAVVRGPLMRLRAGGGCSWRDGHKCEIQVSGAGDARLLAKLGYFDDLSGQVKVEGGVVWRPGSVGWRSRFEAPRLTLFDRPLRDVTGVLVADPQGMQIAVETARYAGGDLLGTVAIDLRDADKPVTIDVDAQNLRLVDVLADQGVEVPGLGGRINGPVRYRFVRGEARRGDGRGEIQIVLDPVEEVDPAARVTLIGGFPIRIVGGRVSSEAIAVQSSSHSLLARGQYDLARGVGKFHYEVASRDIGPLASLLPDAGISPATPLWQPIGGAGRIEGTLDLFQDGRYQTDVRLLLDDVTARSLPTPQQVSGTLRARRDGLSALRIEIGSDDQALLIEGAIPFELAPAWPVGQAVDAGGRPQQGGDQWADRPAFTLVVDAVDWPLEQIRPWVPLEVPLTGRVSGRVVLNTDEADGSIGGLLQAAARPARWRNTLGQEVGPRFDGLEVSLKWDTEQVSFSKISLDCGAGSVLGRGTIDLITEALSFEFKGADLALERAPLDAYRSRGDLRGRLGLNVDLGGTLTRPEVDVAADLSGLTLADAAIGGGAVRGRWDGQTMALDARFLDGGSIRGGGALDDREAGLRFTFDAPDLPAVLRLWTAAIPSGLAGALHGTADVNGAFSKGGPSVVATLESLALSLAGRRLRNRAPAVVRFDHDGGEIVSLRVGEPGTASELRIDGTFGYDADAPLTLGLEGLVAAPWLRLAGLDGLEAGSLQVAGRIEGSMAAPRAFGRGQLSRGRLNLPGEVPHALGEIEASVQVGVESVILETLTATLGGGTIEASGRSDFPTAVIDGAIGAWRHRYQVGGRGVNILVPEGWSLLADADLVLRSRADAAFEVGGRATLERADYRLDLPVGFAQVLSRLLARQRLEVEAASNAWTRTLLNVELETDGGLRVHNNLADLTGSADLVVRGTVAQPVIFGTVEIDQGSELVYNSTEYEIRRGRLTFANPARLDPEVDLEATTRVREFDVNLTLSGTVERMDARFSSEPPLPDLDVFHLLAGGDPVDAVAASVVRDLSDEGGAAGASAAQFLYGQAASLVGERVGALFGFDTFRIDPLTGSGDALSRARVTVGKQLSKDLSVTYSADPSSTEEQRLQVEWRLGRNLVLVLTQNGDETYAADVRLEQAF